MDAIKINDLSVAYEENVIIDGMELCIPKGETSIIIGANGCGKSTLLKTIGRIIKPVKGEIFINGRNMGQQKERQLASQIAFLPQGQTCPSGLTVRELVAFGRFPHQRMIGGLNKHDKEIIEWAMRETEVLEFADRAVENLSGGQRQRAWIAMTLAQETDIIMLDEPTTYLDISYQLEILEVLERLNRQKRITVIMVLHELNHACRFAGKIIGLKKGKVVCAGIPREVITKEALREIYGIDVTLQLDDKKQYPVCVDYKLLRKAPAS